MKNYDESVKINCNSIWPQNLEDYNPTKKRKVLIVFHYMIADMEAIEKYSYSS